MLDFTQLTFTCSKLTNETPELYTRSGHWRLSGVSCEVQIDFLRVFGVSIGDFEQVITGSEKVIFVSV